MSSIFTFDPDPPRTLSSPWPVPSGMTPTSAPIVGGRIIAGLDIGPGIRLADCGVDKLCPEPQDGPLEYKLHLLLRPRKSFSALATGRYISGSYLSKSRNVASQLGLSASSLKDTAVPASSSQSKQSRLQHLTTQLLWRLQQSSPHHSSSKSSLTMPIAPEITDLDVKTSSPNHILPGLEESKGALYEIGVSDDGTLVGLIKDELDESLRNLLVMASSLGCNVKILRAVIVGDCQWHHSRSSKVDVPQKEELWVVEALIVPDLFLKRSVSAMAHHQYDAATGQVHQAKFIQEAEEPPSQSEQLRVSLTGGTTSGKSTLLGTLATSTLDNGRGKSRLSLLKHPHEVASGVTSSVTSLLVGYHDKFSDEHIYPGRIRSDVINYASGNISSWTDIHAASDPGRLVLINDSAGHPRFRRTTVRGLVSWAPHWTICCIAADNHGEASGGVGATASAADVFGPSCVEYDMSMAHLELCLKLRLSLVVAVTKLDLASKNGLKYTLSKVLSVLKSAGRRPSLLSKSAGEESDLHLQSIYDADQEQAKAVLFPKSEIDVNSMVPIVLTSTTTGVGITQVHSLLRELPIPREAVHHKETRASSYDELVLGDIFQIDEVFATMKTHKTAAQEMCKELTLSSVVSGHVSRGSLAVGQEILIGPFSSDRAETQPETEPDKRPIHRSRSYPKIREVREINRSMASLSRPLSGDLSAEIVTNGSPSWCSAWRKTLVGSIRNLRLPVQELSTGQAGTLGFTIAEPEHVALFPSFSEQDRIRRGMVVLSIPKDLGTGLLRPHSGFEAIFEAPVQPTLLQGCLVIVYIASIRASAKVLQLKPAQQNTLTARVSDNSGSGGYRARLPNSPHGIREMEASFCFLHSVEWFQNGSRVLVMPTSGYGSSTRSSGGKDQPNMGLEGLAGRVIETLA
ncbi:MAG: hypothetical protein LQ351_000854 [Letrouitia transgressa]|nr:MAG: hypothetical protein LQ351_000854 [Letrouitia transgressa]